MKIEATEKEIANLIFALQNQREKIKLTFPDGETLTRYLFPKEKNQ